MNWPIVRRVRVVIEYKILAAKEADVAYCKGRLREYYDSSNSTSCASSVAEMYRHCKTRVEEVEDGRS